MVATRLVVSSSRLYASDRGRRPSGMGRGGAPEVAEPLCDAFAILWRPRGLRRRRPAVSVPNLRVLTRQRRLR